MKNKEIKNQQSQIQNPKCLIVPKEKIAANGDYNLSGERYRVDVVRFSSFPTVTLGDICELVRGVVFSKNDEVTDGGVQVLRANNINKDRYELNLDDIKRVSPKVDFSDEKKLKKDDIFICLASGSKDHIGKVALIAEDTEFYFGGFMGAIRVKPDRLHPGYLLKQLTTGHFNGFLREQIAGANINNLSGGLLYRFKIPLPPLEIQKEIVAEIEGYQKIIDGARAVLDNYRPHIPIHPDWPIPSFADAPFQIIDGDRGTNYPSKEDFSPSGHCLFLNTKNVRSDGFKFEELEFISVAKDNALRKGKLERGDVLLTTRGTIGNTGIYDDTVEFDHIRINSGMLIFRPDAIKLLSNYLFLFFQSENFRVQREAIVSGAAQPQLPIRNLNEAKIPLPPLETQHAIVAEIEAEQALVNANRELIERMDRKIQATLARVWGESPESPAATPFPATQSDQQPVLAKVAESPPPYSAAKKRKIRS